MAPVESVQPLYGPKTYENEPPRNPDLWINSKEPYNSEPGPKLLVESFITEEENFYKRNHGPIPMLADPAGYRLLVEGLVPNPMSLSLQDIKSLPKVTIVATLQCAGNRRTEMSKKKIVKGVGWGLGALGTGVWGGALLADVLSLCGIRGDSSLSLSELHVEFVSVDVCKEEEGGAYKASVPLASAMSKESQILVAYEMNGKELNRDHGFPLRTVVPGVIGARSVKWLDKIVVRSSESDGFFVQRDYKMFAPSVDWGNVDWASRRPIMDFPIQSAICEPVDHERVPSGTKRMIRGYAVAGGGRGVERVEVSVNGGREWKEAKRLPQKNNIEGERESGREGEYVADCDKKREKWAWVLWESEQVLEPPCQVMVRAMDSACNVQPESVESIWNLRGVLNNSWHTIHLLPFSLSPL